jgi:hypothetical protein
MNDPFRVWLVVGDALQDYELDDDTIMRSRDGPVALAVRCQDEPPIQFDFAAGLHTMFARLEFDGTDVNG